MILYIVLAKMDSRIDELKMEISKLKNKEENNNEIWWGYLNGFCIRNFGYSCWDSCVLFNNDIYIRSYFKMRWLKCIIFSCPYGRYALCRF